MYKFTETDGRHDAEIEDDASSRTGRRCPQGADLALTKTTRYSFKMLHGSFRNIRSRLRENALSHITEDLSFTAFTTLEHSHRAFLW